MFALYLDDVGPNRMEILKLLRAKLSLPLQEAKIKLSQARPLLHTGTRDQLLTLHDEMNNHGAKTTLEYYPKGVNYRAWIPDSLSLDKEHCSHCGERLFVALPGLTTPDDIRQFAKASKLPAADIIAESGWIHPGVYCPSGCGSVQVNIDG